MQGMHKTYLTLWDQRGVSKEDSIELKGVGNDPGFLEMGCKNQIIARGLSEEGLTKDRKALQYLQGQDPIFLTLPAPGNQFNEGFVIVSAIDH